MVHIAHQFAFINENIKGDMIEGSEFPDLVQRYEVSGVPKTIVNEVHSFEGAIPEGAVFLEILKTVDPEEYEKLDAVIRESRGEKKAFTAEEDHDYEVVIIGGGPAALSAVIYAARKDLDVALITKKFGGQITYTAAVENYLGFTSVGGQDLTTLFRNHVENHAIAEASGTTVVSVKRDKAQFLVKTQDKKRFRAQSIIYCAGMEYRRLGVPGEERFLGKSIGFCATCDAPLYRGKKVAVVGGGNSAFTAVRDLLSFASEIHLIHRRKEFTADKKLVKEVLESNNVTLHTPMVVQAFPGKEKLTGVRIKSLENKKKLDIPLDGVFLEIGLTPNSDPVKKIIQLNRWGEVPVQKDQSTSIPGLFAAGDVTDSSEKQISVAVGDGAKAALSAHKYLVAHKFTKSTKDTRETWQ
jgi:alkyl hydroperoxide reductase subunit F